MGFASFWAVGGNLPPVDMTCRWMLCASSMGKQWRGVVATDSDLWARVEARVCEEHIRLINEGESKSGWILRGSAEGILYFDIPLKQWQWGSEKAK